jgi:hypothetical protein
MRAAAAAVLVVVSVTGCDLELELDFNGSSIQIASDSGRMVVSGCAHDGLLGCEDPPASVGMVIVLDGVRQAVPARVPAPLELFPTRGFELVTRSPVDPYFDVGFTGETISVEELPWFDLDAPASVHRGAGDVTLVFQVYPRAARRVELASMCGTTRLLETLTKLAGDGRIDVPLTNPGFHGPCTHDASVTQTISGPSGGQLDATLEVSRTEHASFSSD